jgi:serine/threonine protein kinase
MEVPQVDGLQVGKLIGSGGSGRVYQARDVAGVAVALKVFDENAICGALLKKMTERLAVGGWPEGVMRLISSHFEERRSYRVMPLVADADAEAQPRPRSLQMSLDGHPGDDTWKLVGSLARALASMHRRRVPHGNLKPGNVFFSDDGDVLLSDWATGNMPGARQFHFTDALLYQPPEQLRQPAGYVDEAGYQWDVFAFGALVYRVLTGRFARCHETFSFVAPAAGVTRKEGLQADLGKVARNLESEPEFSWPDEAQNPLEAGLRGWIERCLHLDPSQRPVSMMEVAAGFEAVEKKLALETERESLMDQRRRSERRAWRTLFFAGIATASALVLGGLWQLSNSKLLNERGERANEVQSLAAVGEAAEVEKSAALAQMTEARQALSYERELSLVRLEASRLIGDRLFSWAMEKGHRRLPPLDGPELRLKRLERYFEDFLTRTTGIETLADERARAVLQLAEISLAAGDAPLATRRLAEALEAWSNLPMDAEFKLRMASNSLLLALLRQSNADPETQPAFEAARRALEAVPQAEVDADRLNQLLAVLDFQEAKLLAAGGDDTKALEQLLRATQTLNRIADHRPDTAILRSELAACYLSSATILEGMGSLGDAREVRVLATAVLVKLLKEQPENATLRLELAGCYGAMAEAAVLSGDIPAAESLSNQAVQLLDQLLLAQPDQAEAVARKAAQLGLRAGILRDRGFAAESLKAYEEAIRMLEAVRASAPNNAMVSYRLALLWWQKGRMLGMGGNRNEEIALIRKARDLLGQLESSAATSGPRPEQLQGSAAYLLGDLGHALQLGNQKDEAIKVFTDAVVLWQNLLASRPQSEEYNEGFSWCRQRLDDLK